MTYTPTVSGVYVVRVTNASGCVYEYSPGYKYTKPNGIKEFDLTQAITVYPNPANDVLFIQDNMKLGQQFLASIYNSYGQLVKNSYNAREIDLTSLANGYYTLNITSQQGTATHKFIIKR